MLVLETVGGGASGMLRDGSSVGNLSDTEVVLNTAYRLPVEIWVPGRGHPKLRNEQSAYTHGPSLFGLYF